MLVPANHAYVRGGGDIIDVLLGVVEHAGAVVEQAAAGEIEHLHRQIQEAAAAHPQWAPMAGAIQHWENEDGNLAIGVPDASPHAKAAMTAEYGDPDTPPVALLRTGLANGVTDMSWSLAEQFRRAGF